MFTPGLVPVAPQVVKHQEAVPAKPASLGGRGGYLWEAQQAGLVSGLGNSWAGR